MWVTSSCDSLLRRRVKVCFENCRLFVLVCFADALKKVCVGDTGRGEAREKQEKSKGGGRLAAARIARGVPTA